MFDGQMAYHHTGAAPVHAPNSGGRPWADETGPAADGWEADGEMVRSAYTLRPEDDDFTQPGVLVRKVFDDAQRAALIEIGRASGRERVCQYVSISVGAGSLKQT